MVGMDILISRFEIEDEDDVSEVLDDFFEVKPIVRKK